MTVSGKKNLKKKQKTNHGYVNYVTENTKLEHQRKLTPETVHGFAEKHSSVMGGTRSLVVRIKCCAFSDSGRQLSSSENNQASSSFKGMSDLNIRQQHDDSNYLDDVQMDVRESSNLVQGVQHSCNYETTRALKSQKGQRMNAERVNQCSGILNKLMTHQYGWVFSHPVDPVKLNIPDYFSIITKPMDLGTIKFKLKNMQYNHTTEFVEDIRLTFANAMRYNPPSNDVHIMAKILGNIFDSCWRSLEARIGESQLHTLQKKRNKNVTNSRQKAQGRSSIGSGSFPRKLVCSVKSRDMKTAYGRVSVEHSDKGSDRSFGSLKSCSISSDTVYESSLEQGEDEESNANSGGVAAIIDDLNAYASSSPAAFGKEYGSSYPDEQLSPTKALRAAMLKSRFADTIFRAQQKTLLDHKDNGDSTKMQQEKIRLERRQQEEKARIEADIRAAVAAVKRKEEEEQRLQRQKEREAARLAVQNMGKTVDIDENYGLLRDLRALGCSLQSEMQDLTVPNFMDGVETPGSSGKPLERLGLFMKDEDMDEDEDEDEDGDSDTWISSNGAGKPEQGEIDSDVA